MPQGITRASITGFEQLIQNLNVEILAIEGHSRKGLIECVKFIQRDCEATEPLLPVDKGNLRSSWQVHMINEGSVGARRFGVRFGYSSNYAMWVHEMIGAVNWTRPGSGAKWLEKSINRNHNELIQIIAAETIVK